MKPINHIQPFFHSNLVQKSTTEEQSSGLPGRMFVPQISFMAYPLSERFISAKDENTEREAEQKQGGNPVEKGSKEDQVWKHVKSMLLENIESYITPGMKHKE